MRRTPGRILLVAVLAFGCLAGTAQAAPTIVSLQFDDGRGEQAAPAILAKHKMHATFFINTGYVGTGNGYFTWKDLRDLAADGHEIAGHTLTHRDVPSLSRAEQQREICGDRNALIARGFKPTNFAYPYGSYDDASKKVVEQCGYASGRAAWGLWGSGCEEEPATCPYAVDPANLKDRWAIPTADAPIDLTYVENLRQVVLKAQANGGGWVQLFWHRICPDGCDQYSWSPRTLDAYLAWLEKERAAGRIEVKTSQEVLGGAFRPAVAPPKPPAAPSGPNRVRNGSLEQRRKGADAPACWEHAGSGDWTRGQGSSGRGQSVSISGAPDGFAALLVTQDQGECSVAVKPGERLTAMAAYRSTDQPRLTVWARAKAGGWSFWRESPRLAPAPGFRTAAFELPPVPKGVTALSVGIALSGNGRLTVDELALTG